MNNDKISESNIQQVKLIDVSYAYFSQKQKISPEFKNGNEAIEWIKINGTRLREETGNFGFILSPVFKDNRIKIVVSEDQFLGYIHPSHSSSIYTLVSRNSFKRDGETISVPYNPNEIRLANASDSNKFGIDLSPYLNDDKTYEMSRD